MSDQSELAAAIAAAITQALGGAQPAPSAVVPATAGRCRWEGADRSEPICGKPTPVKRNGQPRKYCAEHGPLASAIWKENLTASGAFEVSAARRAENVAVEAEALEAAESAKRIGKAAEVRISPQGSSFGLYLQRHSGLGADKVGNAAVVRFPHKGAADAFVKVLREHDWASSTAPTATVVSSR